MTSDDRPQAIENIIEAEDIMKMIPHRYPFLLIDRIVRLDPKPSGPSWIGRRIEAIKNVTVNEPFFTGHFPHRPIMPGVLILEAMAQAAAICGHRPVGPSANMEVLIAAFDNARFRRPVIPGDQLVLKIEMVKDRGSIMGFRGESFVGGSLVAETDMLAKSFPRQN